LAIWQGQVDFYVRLANAPVRARFRAMNTVTEIETAIEKLPVTPAMLTAIAEAERSLADEGGVPVEDVRKNPGQWITA